MSQQTTTSSTEDALIIIFLTGILGLGIYFFQQNYPELFNMIKRDLILLTPLFLVNIVMLYNFFSYKNLSRYEPEYIDIKEYLFLFVSILIFVSIGGFIGVYYFKDIVLFDINIFKVISFISILLTIFIVKNFYFTKNNLEIKATKIRAIPEITDLQKRIGFDKYAKKRVNIKNFGLSKDEIIELTELSDGETEVIAVDKDFVFKEKEHIWKMNEIKEKKEINYNAVNKLISQYKPLRVSYSNLMKNQKLEPYLIIINTINKRLKRVKKEIDIKKLHKNYKGKIEFMVLRMFDYAKENDMDIPYSQLYVYAKDNKRVRKMIGAIDNLMSSSVKMEGIDIFYSYETQKEIKGF